MTSNLQDNLRLLDMIEDTDDTAPDSVDFSWMDNESLITFAMDYDSVKMLDEDNNHALIYELARRFDYVLNEEAPF